MEEFQPDPATPSEYRFRCRCYRCRLSTLLDPVPLFTVAALLRTALLLYGQWQDARSAIKYTDVDYLVFTDAARLVAARESPYARATYRYTPLLAWLLLPTTGGVSWPGFFAFGKVVFALADLVAGRLIVLLLRSRDGGGGGGVGEGRHECGRLTSRQRDGAFAALWLWNPMVATISTRGSSEGLLGVLTMALLWAVERRRVALAGFVLGLSVHFKIYPFIYAPAIVWWMDEERMMRGGTTTTTTTTSRTKKNNSNENTVTLADAAVNFVTLARVKLALVSLATFTSLNAVMYVIYGSPFLVHTFLHHVSRIDHRHNFSPYNVLLYVNSAASSSSASAAPTTTTAAAAAAESLAFVPQLLLSCVLIPLALAKKDLATSMMAQTFAFVTFNKVCTSQYFLWYLIFLPLHLPRSSLLRNGRLGLVALSLWVAAQGAWLQQGYQLEFLGRSTFVPGLWLASLAFFLVNCWILGIVIADGAGAFLAVPRKTHTE